MVGLPLLVVLNGENGNNILMPQITNINLDSLLEIAQRGVRRASVFLALGVNSARDPRMDNYMFPKDVLIQVLHEGLDQKTVEHFKTEFEKWVILSGLRDLTETFSIYLNGVHKVGLLIAVKSGDMKPEEGRTLSIPSNGRGLRTN
jgi:hypothetical protein